MDEFDSGEFGGALGERDGSPECPQIFGLSRTTLAFIPLSHTEFDAHPSRFGTRHRLCQQVPPPQTHQELFGCQSRP
jgi:hypothetical protein